MLDQMIIMLVTMAVVTATELVAPIERTSVRARLTGIFYLVVGSVGGILVYDLLGYLWSLLGVKPLLTVPTWTGIAGIAISLLVFDFFAYWQHRALHRFAWPVHAVHHSAEELCAATNYAHFLESAVRFVVLVVPLSLVKFELAAVPYALLALRSALAFYIHSPTNAHLGPLRWIFVDNRFHRVHHSVEQQHFDKNFGILFSFWDRMFGTAYEPEPDCWPAVGIAGTPSPKGLLDYLLFPLSRFRRRPSHAVVPLAASKTA